MRKGRGKTAENHNENKPAKCEVERKAQTSVKSISSLQLLSYWSHCFVVHSVSPSDRAGRYVKTYYHNICFPCQSVLIYHYTFIINGEGNVFHIFVIPCYKTASSNPGFLFWFIFMIKHATLLFITAQHCSSYVVFIWDFIHIGTLLVFTARDYFFIFFLAERRLMCWFYFMKVALMHTYTNNALYLSCYLFTTQHSLSYLIA